jgi:serine/tyrosine/threonine adenylyltransferase
MSFSSTEETQQANVMGLNLQASYFELPEYFFEQVSPTPVKHPRLTVFNERLAHDLGLHFKDTQAEVLAGFFSGNTPLPGNTPIKPFAQAYAGHQFGHFTMLGDGRAILLGEQLTSEDKRFDIQLKGPGQTPYSRRGDGRAALGPMLREYIISEAMHALDIPTTRSLAVVSTGEPVFRDYPLPGAILTRVAESHIRVGTFEYAIRRAGKEGVKALADYTIIRHFSDLKDPTVSELTPDHYLSFLNEVLARQAKLLAKWMGVGFVHGVMNTDNMSICGETIDYGPCAFMDVYHPATVFSSIDHQGRYAYGNQPIIAQWNLARFAESLIPLLHPVPEEALKIAEEVINHFPALFQQEWLNVMGQKIGLSDPVESDRALIIDLLNLMQDQQADFTNTFRALPSLLKENAWETSQAENGLNFPDAWVAPWRERVFAQSISPEEIRTLLKQSNPQVIPRNHQVEAALEEAEASLANLENDVNLTRFKALLKAVQHPFEVDLSHSAFYEPAPKEAPPYRTFCGT